MPTGIPTDTAFTTVDTITHLDLSDEGPVTAAIGLIEAQMLGQGWTQVGLYASVLMTLTPLVGTDLIFSLALWLTDFEGSAYEVYNTTLGQRDPTGDITGGLPVIGVGVVDQGALSNSAYQTLLINALISKMNASQMVWNVTGADIGGTFGTYQQLLITALLPGPAYNNIFMSANVLGAGNFIGLPTGGGWLFTSVATPGNGSTMSVTLTDSFIHNLALVWNFNVGGETVFHHSPHVYYLNFKSDYYSIVTPYDWKLFHADDGVPYTPHSADEIAFGGDNIWICNPRVPDAQRLDPIAPIDYCGFSVTKNRSLPYESFNCATCINATFFEGPMDAFEVDVGVSLLSLNAMQHAAGELATTAGKSITISSLIALSSAFDGPLQIVGDAWGMYVTTQYVPLDKLSMTNDNAHQMIAYRSQDAPCSMTVWLQIS
jgi:hypothetical protein